MPTVQDPPVDFSTSRPGDDTRIYLGYEQSPQLRATIDAAIAESESNCANEQRRPESDHDTSILEMRWDDIGAFRQKYGYGITLQAQQHSDAAIERQQSDHDDPDVDELDWQAIADCEALISAAIDAALAPIQVHHRFGELVMDFANSAKLQEPTQAWQDCMGDLGFPTTQSPLTSQVIVENELITRYEESLRAASGDRDAVVDHHSEEPMILAQTFIDEMMDFERAVFAADTQCLTQTPAGEAMFAAEQEILTILRAEFPFFDGVPQ